MIHMDRPAKRVAARMADAVLGWIAPLMVTRRSVRTSPPRVLVIRCDHLGDAVLATSVLRPLREALAPERLDVLASPWNASIFEGHSAVDDVLRISTPWWLAARYERRGVRLGAWLALPREIARLRARKYDIAVDLRGDLRQIFLFLALTGVPERVSSDRTGGRRMLTRCAQYIEGRHEVESNAAVAALVGAHGPWRLDVDTTGDKPPVSIDRPFVALGLSSNKPNHRWPLDSAATLARRLVGEMGVSLVWLGGAADRADGDAIARLSGCAMVNAAGTTPRESIAILREAAALVTLDSAPLHLGAAAGCPVVGLFGQSDPVHFAPWGTTHSIVAVGAPCGCANPNCRLLPGADEEGGYCMRQITPDAVYEAVVSIARR